MKTKGLWRTGLLLAAALSLGLTGCGTAGGQKESKQDSMTVLTIGTADSGGSMYPIGSAIAQAITDADSSVKVNISASTGSSMNVEALAAGEIDLGLVSGDVAYAAYHGQDVFEQPVDGLRAVAALDTSVSTWLAPSSTGAVYVHDLVGMSVGVGPQTSSTELSARIAVDVLDLDREGTQLENCALGSAVERVDGVDLDAIHGFSGSPIPGLTELAQKRSCTVLGYDQQELDSILARNSCYYRATIPAGTYPGQKEDVESFGVKGLLCVSEDMDEEQVYRLTKALWESRETLAQSHPALKEMLQEGFMDQDLPIPLHPGAQRFYEEMSQQGAI